MSICTYISKQSLSRETELYKCSQIFQSQASELSDNALSLLFGRVTNYGRMCHLFNKLYNI